ncbi:hypothetical protein CV102_12285 [Natronococcus pandeyae]|uniref:Uncharacterized protein n=1 Tax=Natronococcus pandeyae TaxID=2055836 RepID=A0A8J8Q1U5_9EURY|nr:hypothetical protein [Natronococcus pandeyae]TYL38570.1 hypothetical protein CV102_12285 [Natronococcus pandeyae]
MKQCPRRTLLGGIGTTITVALAGNAAAAADDRSASAADADESAVSTFESVLDYLPASVAEDSMMLTATDVERQLEADEPHERRPFGGAFEIEPESVSKKALVYANEDGFSRPIKVLTGDIELEGDNESRETDGGVSYEYYDDGRVLAGVADDVVVLADERETIEDAFDAGADETERLLEAESVLEEALETYDGVDSCHVQIGDDEDLHLPIDVDDEDDAIRYLVHGTTVVDSDTIEMTHGIEFADESFVTEELVDALGADLGYMAVKDEPTVEVDETLVTATLTRDLELERAVREHDSPGFLRPSRNIDPDDDVLEIELGRGDPTPVEDLTLELDGEEYDREIWADGHGKLEEGDMIEVDMDDVEPNLSVRLHHDHELGSSGSGTTILSHFRFTFDYDVDSETVTAEYGDEYPLDGDRVFLAAYEERHHYRPGEDEPEPRAESQPWTDETLSSGDTGTLEGVQPGDRIVVGWDGTSSQDSIGHFRARPPGRVRFDYEYESETLSATLELEDERSADRYELLVDDEPADTQWVDEATTVESGATIDVSDVPVGSDVTVVWDDDVRVSGTRPQPRVDLVYDDGDVEHLDGDALPASKLEARVWTEDERLEIDLVDQIDGEFEVGDSFTVDADEIHGVTLIYDEQHRIGHAYPTR